MKFILLALIASSISFVNSDKIVGCSWTPIKHKFSLLNAAACTHIDVANFFVDGNVPSLLGKESIAGVPLSDELSELKSYRVQNPDVKFKVFAVVDSDFVTDFRKIVLTPSLTTTLIDSIVAVANNGYDGVTMKIYLPLFALKIDLGNFLNPLKAALQAKGQLLNVRVFAATTGLEPGTICRSADYVTIDPYQPPLNTDFRPFALYSQVDADVKKFISAGCPKTKLILGFTTLGYRYYKNSNKADTISYRDFFSAQPPLAVTSLLIEASEVFTGPDFQVIIDLPTGVKAKTAIAKDLAGAFLIHADQDDNEGITRRGKWPILAAIIDGLKNPPAPLNSLPAAPLTKNICSSTVSIGDPHDCRKYYTCSPGYSLPTLTNLCLNLNFDTKTNSCQPIATAVCAK